ncbi:MAG: tetratricopeptide repeat protein [Chloroflexi bacterium]|nr:tetratricopeptide repeat protein [Chloroflexota bacterium]MCI0577179.1 tetratricopeptide repeat protein [Chloroflexota bacterium]MCI0649253.1 tetratricopeptide repeat protein [Chloroflexota bacterium]MCI0730435.1 tetratricopeptide repeat protein [Chloroflexota bacterium]
MPIILETLQRLLQQASAAAQNNEPALAVQFHSDLLAQSAGYGDNPAIKELRLQALARHGQLLGELGDQEGALASLNQYYLEAGTSQQAVDALALLGNQYSRMGQQLKALAVNQEALQLAVALNYTGGRAQALMHIGWTQLGLGRTEEALVNLNKAYALFSQINDQVGQMRSVSRIGIVHMSTGEIDKAIAAFKLSLNLGRGVGDRETAIDLGNLGECYQMLFDMEQALACHQKGLAIAERTKLQVVSVDLCRNLGLDLYYLGRIEEGLAYLRRALTMSEEIERPDLHTQALYSLALAEVEQGEVDAARQHGQQLKALAEATNARGYLAYALHILGLCHEKERDWVAAEQAWQQAVFLAHETNWRALLWQLHAALARIASNPALAGIHKRIAAEVIQQIVEPIEDEALKQKFLAAPPVQAILLS